MDLCFAVFRRTCVFEVVDTWFSGTIFDHNRPMGRESARGTQRKRGRGAGDSTRLYVAFAKADFPMKFVPASIDGSFTPLLIALAAAADLQRPVCAATGYRSRKQALVS